MIGVRDLFLGRKWLSLKKTRSKKIENLEWLKKEGKIAQNKPTTSLSRSTTQ